MIKSHFFQIKKSFFVNFKFIIKHQKLIMTKKKITENFLYEK